MNWKVENDVREARPAAGPRPASPLTCSCHVGRGGTQREPASHQIGGRGALRPLGRGKAHAARAFEVPNRRGKGSVRVRKRVCSRSRYDKVIARRWRGSTRTQICSMQQGLPARHQLSLLDLSAPAVRGKQRACGQTGKECESGPLIGSADRLQGGDIRRSQRHEFPKPG